MQISLNVSMHKIIQTRRSLFESARTYGRGITIDGSERWSTVFWANVEGHSSQWTVIWLKVTSHVCENGWYKKCRKDRQILLTWNCPGNVPDDRPLSFQKYQSCFVSVDHPVFAFLNRPPFLFRDRSISQAVHINSLKLSSLLNHRPISTVFSSKFELSNLTFRDRPFSPYGDHRLHPKASF